MHRLHVECFPDDIPEHIEINIEPLAINHSIHVRDITLPNVHIIDNVNNTIVSVIPPVVEKAQTPEELAAAAAATAAEPEVIKKGKADEEEEAEPAKK